MVDDTSAAHLLGGSFALVQAAATALERLCDATPAELSDAVTDATKTLGALWDVPAPDGCTSQWWHGGAAGLQPGDKLLPPDVTGHQPIDGRSRRDRVYVTSRFGAALFHAVGCHGSVYGVRLGSAPEPDPQAPVSATAFMVRRAVVVEVVLADG